MDRTTKEISQDLGRYAEMLFQAEAVRRGLGVYAPIQSFAHVDCLVESATRIWRVQIKARHPTMENGVASYKFDRGRGGRFSSDDVDVVAGYMVDRGEWLFVPSSVVHGKFAARLPLSPRNQNSMASEWRDWSIFTVPANSAPLIHADLELT